MSELLFRPIDFKKYETDGTVDFTPIHLSLRDNIGTVDPTFSQSFMAGLKYQWLPITNRTSELFEFKDVDHDDSFNFKDRMKEDNTYIYAEELSRAKNNEHYDYILNNVKAIEQNRSVYDRSGFGGALVAGVVDPLNIAFMMPVFNTGIRAAWSAKSALGVGYETAKVGGIFGITGELLRAPFDPFSTAQEVTANIATNTAFSGLLGGGARGVANGLTGIGTKIRARKDPLGASNDIEEIRKLREEGVADEGLTKLPLDKFTLISRFIPSEKLQRLLYKDGKNITEAPDNVREAHRFALHIRERDSPIEMILPSDTLIEESDRICLKQQ